MHIYRCFLTLMEATFFSSREISALYQTEALLGNYALAYAFGFCQSSYHNDGTIHYVEHLQTLNRRGIYVTPGTFWGQPQFVLRTINAQTDAYWSQYGRGVIAARSEFGWSETDGVHTYPIDEHGKRGQRFGAINRPQFGRLRMLAIGNQAVCYVLSEQPVDLPEYIRLGKFMSKARVETEMATFEIIENDRQTVSTLLNPADLGPDSQMLTFDMISVPPTPLVRNALIEGRFYRLSRHEWLPTGMRFGVEQL